MGPDEPVLLDGLVIDEISGVDWPAAPGALGWLVQKAAGKPVPDRPVEWGGRVLSESQTRGLLQQIGEKAANIKMQGRKYELSDEQAVVLAVKQLHTQVNGSVVERAAAIVAKAQGISVEEATVQCARAEQVRLRKSWADREAVRKAAQEPGALEGIGQEIRVARVAKALTQEQLAGLCGVSRNAVVAWEGGRYMPEGSQAFLCAEVLGLGAGAPRRMAWANRKGS